MTLFYRYQTLSNLRNLHTELEKAKICLEFSLEKWRMPTKHERQKLETRLCPKQIIHYWCYIILTLFRKHLRRSAIVFKDWNLWEKKFLSKRSILPTSTIVMTRSIKCDHYLYTLSNMDTNFETSEIAY